MSMGCCQVALSTLDLSRSHWWYQHALGFVQAGERRHRDGPRFAAVAGLPEASFDVWCLMGRRDGLQIEMFEFSAPRMRSRPTDRRPCDIGYSTIGIHVNDFDRAMERVERIGGQVRSAPVGEKGRRRVCLEDPDGTLLELMEDEPAACRSAAAGPRDELPAIVSVSISVRNLEKAREFWTGTIGFPELDSALHDPKHEELWGLTGATRETILVGAGNVVLELVQYHSPKGKARPAGYLLSDQGILNIAMGFENSDELNALYGRLVRNGFAGHTEPWTLPDIATVVYLTDSEALSLELLHVQPQALERMGFVPSDPTPVGSA